MESLKRLSDIPPDDLAAVERMFGQRIASPDAAILILKTHEPQTDEPAVKALESLPDWLNVLEGMSDGDLAEFDQILKTPVVLTQVRDDDEATSG